LVVKTEPLDVGITALDSDGDPLTFILSEEPVFAAYVDHVVAMPHYIFLSWVLCCRQCL